MLQANLGQKHGPGEQAVIARLKAFSSTNTAAPQAAQLLLGHWLAGLHQLQPYAGHHRLPAENDEKYQITLLPSTS